MVSESARMSSAAESRFRVQAPNSSPRATKVIALDSLSECLLRRLADGAWRNTTFFTAPASTRDPEGPHAEGCLRDLAGHPRLVQDEMNGADLVIMVVTAGGNAEAASVIGRACSVKRVSTTALVTGIASASDQALSNTLGQLRPWALMVVMADDDDYIREMMTALRA
jgi:hypothetical protein